MKKEFFNNGVFTPIVGKEFWKDGELDFGTPNPDYTNEDYDKHYYEKRDGSYRTQFFRVFRHDGKILGDCDHNLRFGLRRLTALKDPDKDFYPKMPGEDTLAWYVRYNAELADNQARDFEECDTFHDTLRDMYTSHFDTFNDVFTEAEDHHADPHAKKDEREIAWDDLLGCDRVCIYDATWTYRIELKNKRDEFAKPGKYGRCIADLGCPASLLGFRITEFMKEAMAHNTLIWHGYTAVFCKKPDYHKLVEIFENLINPPDPGYFVFFSDDSCFSTRINGKVYIFNIDISSCDASHGPTIFEGLKRLFPPRLHDVVDSLIKQCEEPITLYSRYDRRKRCRLKPSRPVLYSGSTITTCINNYANLRIFRRIVQELLGVRTMSTEAIRHAAFKCGYAITLDECKDYYDIQFLKHSPVYDVHGDLHPLINFGVFLRASGTCRGDLPGSGDLETRAKVFQKALLDGIYPRVSCPIIEKLKAECATDVIIEAATSAVEKQFAHKLDLSTRPHIQLTDEELLRRYRVSSSEVHTFEEDLELPPFTLHTSCSLTNKVFIKDYDLRAAGFPRE